jgi:hypothetical protein
MKGLLALVGLLAGMVAVIVMLAVREAPEQGGTATPALTQDEPASTKPGFGATERVAAPVTEVEAVPIEVQPTPLRQDEAPSRADEALASMRGSLQDGDARTPELAESRDLARPDAATLADPQLYEQWEQQQSNQIAAAYLASIQEIPMLRELIRMAKASGSQTAEEIADAEEALEQMVLLREELEREYPELIEQFDQQVPPEDWVMPADE